MVTLTLTDTQAEQLVYFLADRLDDFHSFVIPHADDDEDRASMEATEDSICSVLDQLRFALTEQL